MLFSARGKWHREWNYGAIKPRNDYWVILELQHFACVMIALSENTLIEKAGGAVEEARDYHMGPKHPVSALPTALSILARGS